MSWLTSVLQRLGLEQAGKSAELEARTVELTARTAELEAKRAELTTRTTELEAKRAELTAKSTELTAKTAELTAKTAELTAKTAQVAKLQGAVRALEQKLAEQQSSQHATEEALNNLRQELASARKASDELRKQLEETRTALSEARRTAEELRAKAADLEQKVAQQEAARAKAEQQFGDLRVELASAQRAADKQRKQLEETRTALSEARRTAEELQAKAAELEQKVAQEEKARANTEQERNQQQQRLNLVNLIMGAQPYTQSGRENKRAALLTSLYDLLDSDLYTAYNRLHDRHSEYFDDWREQLTATGIRADGTTEFNLYYDDLLSRYKQWAAQQRKFWLRDRAAVAFIGEFNAGKTSIVKQILETYGIPTEGLHVDQKATTALPTYICGGNIKTGTTPGYGGNLDQLLFVVPNGTVKQFKIDGSALPTFSKEQLEGLDNIHALVKYLVRVSPNRNFQGFCLLDTPGFESNDKQDATRTLEVVNESDALFWVFDINDGGLNDAALNIIKEHLTKPLYIVMNKVDLKSPKAQEQTIEHVRQQLAAAGISCQGIIPYSQAMKTDTLTKVLWQVKTQREQHPQTAFIEQLHKDLKNFYDSLDMKLNETKKENEKLAHKQETLQNEVHALQDVVADNCEKIVNMPAYNTHIFSSNCYEIPTYEWKDFKERITSAEEQSKRLCELSRELQDTQKQVQDTDHIRKELRIDLHTLKRCLDKVEDIQGKLENLDKSNQAK